MLFVMALMIIFGTAGAWKIRTLCNSRQAVWRSFWPRTGQGDPRPRGWPQSAELRAGNFSPGLFPNDPYDGFEVVRGPVIVEPNSGASLPVRTERLDMTTGLIDGFARIKREFPIFSKLPPHEFNFPRHHNVLDGTRWQFRTMQIWSNIARRIPSLYTFQLQALVPDLGEAFTNFALRILTNPNKAELLPLEGGDPEVQSLIGRRSPDFQPKIRFGQDKKATIPALYRRRLRPTDCRTDSETINGKVRRQIRDVRQVPRRMSDYYIRVYQSVIARLENSDPPPPGAAGLIGDLQQKVNQLQQFRASLPP